MPGQCSCHSLGRLHGINEKEYTGSHFKDVEVGKWYSPYVAWATENSIIFGYSDGSFGTNDPITREEMCVILERYIKYAGFIIPEENSEITFIDSNEISTWAKASVVYIQKIGLIEGVGGNRFNPKGKATRAEVAAVYYRLIRKVVS